MSSFITFQREALDHPLFRDGKRFHAWFWIVAKACWKPTRFNVGGKLINLERGQFCCSVRELAAAWGWSKSAVERFLIRLKTETMIETDAGPGRMVITVCNYDKYQGIGGKPETATGTSSETVTGQQRDIKEQGNKGTIDTVSEAQASSTVKARASSTAFPFDCPEGVDPIDWDALKQNRKVKRAPLSEGAHRQIIRKLEDWSRAGWPPGPVVAFAAERGWTSVFETDEMKAPKNGRPQSFRNTAVADNRDGVAKALDRRLGLDPSAGAFGRSMDGPAEDFGELPHPRLALLR